MRAIRNFIVRWQNTLVALALIAIALIALRCWPRPPLSSFAPTSTAVLDDQARLLRLTLSGDDKYRLWVPLEQMPADLIDGVKLQEDRWFYLHPGFNPASLLRGAWMTYVRNGNRQGGSTLTMQLARLLYRLNTRTPGGKLRQLCYAIGLELRYSKHDILEAYLNYAPYGRNIEGVGAASRIYFGKPVAQLSLPEVLTLAVIPQDPTRRLREVGDRAAAEGSSATLGKALEVARNRLFERWLLEHPGDRQQAALFRLPLALRVPSELPFSAPHAVEQVLQETAISGQHPAQIVTTLDARLQSTLEREVERSLAGMRERGVKNAAAILVDTRDMGVKALVGSANYSDASIYGQVNGANAKRSPGSTLKPFIYALAIDQGVLHPKTVLRDVPTSFGPFTPENFDGRFLGPVTATEALIRSRNIPAVYVASRLGNPGFYDFLRAAGIGKLASEKHYGLALVLGGGEVTMEELASLYAMLANRGVMRPLRFTTGERQVAGERLLSEEASFMTLDMLRQNQRPDDALVGTAAHLPVYWKTGTSWGFHDAWTAGIFGPYVLVVWMGNFDGSGNPALVGIEAAAPMFFRISDALVAEDRRLAEPAWTIPAHVKQVEICLASGDLPNAWCPQRGTTWFIPGKSPIAVSTVHRPVMVDNQSGKVACPPYDPAQTHVEVYEYWRSDLAKVFADAGIPRRRPPANPDCALDGMIDGEAPKLTSPLRGATYTLRQNRIGEEHIAFAATVDAAVRTVYWFVDQNYAGQSPAGESLFWTPDRGGRHLVRVVDDHGRVDDRELSVTVVE